MQPARKYKHFQMDFNVQNQKFHFQQWGFSQLTTILYLEFSNKLLRNYFY